MQRAASLPESYAGHQIRSTWLTASMDALRRRGYFEEYARHLDPRHLDALVSAVAGTWLSAELAVAHYRACDALDLPAHEQFDMGLEVGAFAHRSYLAFVLQMARSAGANPFTVLDALPKLWGRMWRGGELTARKVGPKDACIDIADWAVAPIPYVRVAARGIITALSSPLALRVYVTEVREGRGPLDLGYRVAWV